MKNFLINWKKNKYTLFILLVLLAAFIVRFYNFANRVNFGPEQGISLISAAENLDKFSLLGIPYLLRETSSGLRLFTAPLFGYGILPLLILFKFDPIPITAYFALLNLITGVLLYWVVKKIFNPKLALITAVLFLFNNYMIYHSLFIWTSNYLPLFGVISLYLIFNLIKKRNDIKSVFALGVVSGVAFGIQYFYFFTLALLFFVCLYLARRKIYASVAFVLGVILGELPTVIFDLRHSFYHIKTLSMYFLDTVTKSHESNLSYYHLLNYWPLVALVFAVILLYGLKNAKFILLFLLLYVYINLTSSNISFKHPIGMEDGLNWMKIKQASEIIAKDNPKNFNLVSLLDFDARAFVLRYPIEYIYGKKPMGVEEYPKANNLYVLVDGKYDFDNPKVWEISSFQPYSFELLNPIDDNYAVYKLSKK